jgi:hypothetical protein
VDLIKQTLLKQLAEVHEELSSSHRLQATDKIEATSNQTVFKIEEEMEADGSFNK